MDNRATFDDLLQALQSSLVAAQGRLRNRRDEELRKLNAAQATDGGQVPVFNFLIPRAGGDANAYDSISLPVSSFHQSSRPSISQFRLSFGCELQEHSFFGSAQGYSLLIVEKSGEGWGRRKPLRMQIDFRGAEDPVGEVRLNGELFVDIPSLGKAFVRPTSIEQQWLVFSWLLRLWRCLWPPRGFTMTPEQSRRIREIVKQNRPESFLEDELAAL